MGEQKYVCEICGRKCCSFGGMKLHKNSCVRLEENKLDIINEYKDVGSVQKVARTRHINIPDLSERLKIWGVKLKYQDSDRYYHKGVRYSFDEDYFNVLGDRQYWMLGMFASDGNIKGNHITISQSGEDGLKAIQYILNEFQSDYPPRISYPKNGKPVYSISFSSGKIRDVFHKFNILERKTKTYSLPDCIDDVYLPAFLAGYIEGDGCITIAKDKAEPKYLCVSFVGTKQFIEECAKRIPVPGHVRKHSQSDVYEIRWNSKNAVDFCGWIYGDRDLYHSYKYRNYKEGIILYSMSRRAQYENIKNMILDDFNSGRLKTVRECIKKYSQNEQVVYKWFKDWLAEGKLARDYHLEESDGLRDNSK